MNISSLGPRTKTAKLLPHYACRQAAGEVAVDNVQLSTPSASSIAALADKQQVLAKLVVAPTLDPDRDPVHLD